jgi:hypothetical protein
MHTIFGSMIRRARLSSGFDNARIPDLDVMMVCCVTLIRWLLVHAKHVIDRVKCVNKIESPKVPTGPSKREQLAEVVVVEDRGTTSIP